MGNWGNFSILWMLTGRPVAARAAPAFQRGRRLRLVLLHNPHDRKARADLGQILISQRRHARAIEVVKPLADADPHDVSALYLLGIACLATGRIEQGELFLTEVHEADPAFRGGAALLELGRHRIRRGAGSAVVPLRAFLDVYPHHVEARFLLSRAHQLAGNGAAATAERDRCWQEYETDLPYQRRRDRLWAWRARPSRPLLYAAIACCAVALLGMALQRSGLASPPPAAG